MFRSQGHCALHLAIMWNAAEVQREWRQGYEYCTQTPKKSTLFNGQYLRNHWTLDIGVLGYIGIVWPKEHPREVWSVPPVTPSIVHTTIVYSVWRWLMKLKHVAGDKLLIKLYLDLFLYSSINRFIVHVSTWRYRQVVSCCRHSNEPSGSIKCREFLDWLMN